MSNQKLFTVEDIFKIAGREGIVVVGKHQSTVPKIEIGNGLILIKPDGIKLNKEIGGIELFQTVSGIKKIAFLIKNTTKADVPIGTEILLKN